MFLQQFPKEPDRGPPMPSRLDQDVEHVAVCIGGAPQALAAPVDGDEQLVEVPDVSQPIVSAGHGLVKTNL